MALITKPNTFSAGATIVASEHNANFDTIYSEFNGNIDNANLKSSANIADTKLAQISTAGKVSFAALTIGSQAQGDLVYAASGTTWARLGAGTSGQFLQTQGAAANPQWASIHTSSTADVVTDETTTSTSYTDLATSGPAVTLTPGVTATHLLLVAAEIRNQTDGQFCYASVAIAGAAASDNDAIDNGDDGRNMCSKQTLATSQASGATHTMKYKVQSSTGNFTYRRIIGVVLL